jgi:hypothetical protein
MVFVRSLGGACASCMYASSSGLFVWPSLLRGKHACNMALEAIISERRDQNPAVDQGSRPGKRSRRTQMK